MLAGYLGSYANGGEGIYRFLLNEKTGELSSPELFCNVKNSKYIADGKDGFLYSVYSEGDNHGVAVCSYNGDIIDRIAFDPNAPCHIVVDKFIYTANYSAGTVTKLSFDGKKLKLIKKVLIKEQAGCHQVVIANNFIFLPCLLLDKVLTLDFDLNILNETTMPEKSGPRHAVISPDNKKLYLVAELSNELYSFNIEGINLKRLGNISLLPKGDELCEGSAAIRLSANGKFLMVSTRFKNLITMLNIEDELPVVTQYFHLNGDHPRDILNVSDDRFLLVANRFSDQLLCLALNDGIITKQCSEISIPQGVSILMKGEMNG